MMKQGTAGATEGETMPNAGCEIPGKRAACGARLRKRVSPVLLLGFLAILPKGAIAYTPESPEVKKLVASGLAVLEKETDKRLGGKCLIGLAFFKSNKGKHPRVGEAVQACRAAMTAGKPISIYSNGLAIIFLCELGPKRYKKEIGWYLDLLKRRQKPHGGWGYDHGPEKKPTGDTSQTQYGALSYWEAHRNGFRIEASSLERVADWLIRTQDPSGAWGYQGVVSTTPERVKQSRTGNSMAAAGLGSILICADLFNAIAPEDGFESPDAGPQAELPDALRRAGETKEGPAPKMRTSTIDTTKLLDSIQWANDWMDENYKVKVPRYGAYYLYSLERAKSFQELFDGVTIEEPQWYNDGYEHLLASQSNGGWNTTSGRAPGTAFAILFLLRSTQKSIQSGMEGTLVGGRGIPANVARAKMRHGQIVVEQVQTKVDELLMMLDDPDQDALDELARNPSSLIVGKVDRESARRLTQLVRGGEPELRLLAVRALARSGELDYVPSLLYALTDPDPRIVLEARDGLRFLSRRFEGFGLPDRFNEQQRYEAITLWKDWYRSLRP